jgi:hypothetical protein
MKKLFRLSDFGLVMAGCQSKQKKLLKKATEITVVNEVEQNEAK